MNEPYLINSNSFQLAWIEAVKLLLVNKWSYWNLVVHVTDTTCFDFQIHKAITNFADTHGLIRPKGVAYTIFPYKLYNRVKSAEKVYNGYNDTIYPWTRKRPRRGWGTYFYRMINYDGQKKVNQLDNIITAINKSSKINKAAYTMVIGRPGGETIRPRGAPCLNYIAIQMQKTDVGRKISLLVTYRNHDFLQRAYGNYWGLCHLLNFIARETNSQLGTLTCVSSHAYVDNKKSALKHLVEAFS